MVSFVADLVYVYWIQYHIIIFYVCHKNVEALPVNKKLHLGLGKSPCSIVEFWLAWQVGLKTGNEHKTVPLPLKWVDAHAQRTFWRCEFTDCMCVRKDSQRITNNTKFVHLAHCTQTLLIVLQELRPKPNPVTQLTLIQSHGQLAYKENCFCRFHNMLHWGPLQSRKHIRRPHTVKTLNSWVHSGLLHQRFLVLQIAILRKKNCMS